MLDFLPEKLKTRLYLIEGLNEIKLRCNYPVKYHANGKTASFEDIVYTKEELYSVLLNACKGSIYSYENELKLGYVTVSNGVRVGIAGELVLENSRVTAVKEVYSLTIRIPSFIKGVSNPFLSVFLGGSVLVVSRSGVGKTTFLRDFTYNLSEKFNKNVTLVDERNEIAAYTSNNPFEIGGNVDVLTYATKNYGFTQGIRTLNPDYIVTDELITEEDVNSVIKAVYSGVSVVASVHAGCVNDLTSKKLTKILVDSKVIDYFVFISKNGIKREYSCFDNNLKLLCRY